MGINGMTAHINSQRKQHTSVMLVRLLKKAERPAPRVGKCRKAIPEVSGMVRRKA
jgi:hypothetical protein